MSLEEEERDGTQPRSTGWGVDVQTHYLSSNPHGREFRFLFILEAHARPGTHVIDLEDYAFIFHKD